MAGAPRGAWYNEHDPFAAQWLRSLIAAGHIASGEVDERDIRDVRPDELAGFHQCHFFAGIGGWSYALRLAGWPDDRPVWTGSCPCQPFSAAGKGKAADDERHLWPAWFSLIAECRPAVVFGEQVEAAIGWGWLDFVFADLEGEGYACGAADLCAAGVGAPHIRQRLWWVGDASFKSRERHAGGVSRAQAPLDGERVGVDGRGPVGSGDAGPGMGGLADANGKSIRGRSANDGGPAAEIHQAWHQRERLRADDGANCPTGGLADHAAGELGDADDTRPQGRVFGGNGADQRPSRPAGLAHWSDCEWIPCRDGKARPAQSALQCMVDGLSACLGLMCAAEKEEVINAAQSSGIGDEVLRALRSDYEPEEIWRALGGYLGFPQATILLACLCQQAGELGHIFDGAASCIKQDQKANVRNLRQSGSPARSPHGWQLPQQCADQFADTLHSLSHAAPQIAEALCRLNGADGYPLAHNIQGRVGRLRGAGNAIVPQLAAQFIGAFLDVT